jgi:hypothetical protein
MIGVELSAYDACVEVNAMVTRHVIGASLTTQWLTFPRDARYRAFWFGASLDGEVNVTLCGFTLALYYHQR